MSFFSELKRRNVFKVGIAYAIVAWLLIQIASILFPTFHAPEWVMQVFTVVIILGFPVALILAWAYELTPEGIKVTTSEGPTQYHTRTTGKRLNYFIIGVIVLAVTFILVNHYVHVGGDGATKVASVTSTTTNDTVSTRRNVIPETTNSIASNQVRRSSIVLGQTLGLPPVGNKAFVALSRDGETLTYIVNEEGTPHLYHRQLNQLAAQLIPNVYNPRILCFSPDGKWVGTTSTGGGLGKVSLLGGVVHELVHSMDTLHGCFWAKDNMIYFSLNNKLHRVPAGGGEPAAVNITSDYSKWGQTWPYGLPNGKHLLLTVSQGDVNAGHTALLSLETGKTQILIQNAYNARYVPTGHIVFMRTGSLWAVPFNMKQLKTTGPEVPVINGVETHINSGIAGYTVSDNGLLVYLPGTVIAGTMGGLQEFGLVWVDRQGNESRFDDILQSMTNIAAPRLSPNGNQLAVGIQGQSGSDIWVYNFERGTFNPQTFIGNAYFPIWTPDGKRLVYYDRSENDLGISWTKANGTGQPERLIVASNNDNFAPYSFTPDGSQLIITNLISSNNIDIHALSMTGERTQRPLLATEFIESQPMLSPDGHWLAYASNETGQTEVYVRPFPNVDNGKWQISTGGGMEPQWHSDGKELYYALGQMGGEIKGIAAVIIDTKSSFQAGKPKILFTGNYASGLARSYDVTADGQRFIMLKRITETGDYRETKLTNLVMVDNWFEELKHLAPPAK